MRFCFSILVTASLFLLIQCKSKNEEVTQVTNLKFTTPQPNLFSSKMGEYRAAGSMCGEWQYMSTNIFYSAELTINGDGTFHYFDQSCLGKRFTEGKWIDNGLNQVLTSLDKYRNDSDITADTTLLFFDKKIIRFKDGFICEVDEKGNLSNSKYFQTKNYR